MKPFLLLLLFGPIISQAQITTPIVKANFGVDATCALTISMGSSQVQVMTGGTTEQRELVVLSLIPPGPPQLLPDIIATFHHGQKRMASFWRGMSLPKFTIWNNRLWLDAIYVRDYHGTDTTVFTVASKNGESSAIWTPGIQAIPDKNDILDTYMHIRRAGPNTTDSLWMFGGISMDNVTGNRYF